MLFNWTFIYNYLWETENSTTHLPLPSSSTSLIQLAKGTELYCNSMLRVTFSDLVTNIWIYNLWHPIVKGMQLPWHLWKLSQRDRRLHKLQSLWFPQLPLCSYSPNLADSKARRWSTCLPLVSGHSFLKVKSSAAAYSHIGLQHIRRLWWIPQNTWLCKSYTEPGLEKRGCVIVIPQHSHFLQGHSNSWNIRPSHGIRPKDNLTALFLMTPRTQVHVVTYFA